MESASSSSAVVPVEQQPEASPKDSFHFPSSFPIRVRAHCNPLSDEYFQYPASPNEFNIESMYPQAFQKHREECLRLGQEKPLPRIEICDVGCAYGGLLVDISALFPDKLMVGMEIRAKVAEFTRGRMEGLRVQYPGQFENINAIRTNVMKYLPCYFQKGQLEKIMFCFPDPHFKKRNFRRRIISPSLVADYAYVLKEGGILYTISDVEDLGAWMNKHLVESPMFERIPDEEVEKDPIVPFIRNSSEDAKRTDKRGMNKYLNVFRRVSGRRPPPKAIVQ